MSFRSPSFIVGLTALIIVCVTTLPTLLNLYKRAKHSSKNYGYREIHKLYEDKDGVATEETANEYTAAIPKFIALTSTLLGLAAAVVNIVITSTYSSQSPSIGDWIAFSTWVSSSQSVCSST